MSTTQIVPDIAPKPLAGKYDRRKFNGANFKNLDRPTKRGTKPLYLRQLCRSTSKRVLEELERIAQITDIYRKAWETNDLRLCAELQRDVRDRYFGKAFTSVNPDEESKAGGIIQDSRLQVAIQQLVIAPGAAKSRKRKPLDATTTTHALPEASQDATTQPAIEAAAKAGGLK